MFLHGCCQQRTACSNPVKSFLSLSFFFLYSFFDDDDDDDNHHRPPALSSFRRQSKLRSHKFISGQRKKPPQKVRNKQANERTLDRSIKVLFWTMSIGSIGSVERRITSDGGRCCNGLCSDFHRRCLRRSVTFIGRLRRRFDTFPISVNYLTRTSFFLPCFTKLLFHHSSSIYSSPDTPSCGFARLLLLLLLR